MHRANTTTPQVTGTWLTINSGTGEVKVDTDLTDEETVYVRINYAGAN
jgi:hypothetical protein